MIKKNIAIEILPRALFGVMMVCLLLGQYLILWPPRLTDNILLLWFGIILSIGGFTLLMYVAHQMRAKGGFRIKNKIFITDGLFQYIRHPMYVSGFIMIIGIGILFFSWSWFVILIAFTPIWYIECRIEEKHLIKLFGEKYLNYKRKTGMSLPRIKRWYK